MKNLILPFRSYATLLVLSIASVASFGQAPVQVTIPGIQGVKSTTAATISPYVGQQVQTDGVVTAVLSNGFFIQTTADDGNPLTPEGIEVFTSSHPTVVVGNYVQVVGTVATFPAATASHTPATEITAPTSISVLTASVPLPAPVTLDATMLTAAGGLYQLTPYEGMRVKIASMTAISGTNGSITSANEASETATSTGYFYAVITGTARPFREPGIDIRDTPLTGAPANIAKFDDNPERILVDSTLAGGTSLEISTGTVLPNVTGVLDFTFSSDSFYDPSRLILDATYDRTQVSGGMTVQPLPAVGAKQFTVASFNVQRLYNTSSTDDLYYVPAGVIGYNGSSPTGTVSNGQTYQSAAVDVNLAAYQRRLQKVALAICNVLNAPDIVTLEEVENQSVANDIAAQINTTCSVGYTAYSTDNSVAYTQDGTGISVGFLVKNSTVDTLGLAQVGANETFTSNGSTLTLNDRPWLALNAGIKRGAGAKDYSVIVIVNHLRSLSGINANTASGANARTKKELQAEEIAKFIQSLQAQKQHVISGGDFNAFEFSDGYTDTLATYTNTNVLSADKVVVPGVAGLVTPPLSDLTLTLDPKERWSYVEDGNAQVLDHMVVTPELVSGSHLVYAHMNADFPVTAYNDATTAARTSDHDPVVGYFTVPAPVLSVVLLPASADFGSSIVGVATAGTVFTLGNVGEAPISITSITITGDFAQTNNCGATLAINTSCKINVVFTPTAGGNRTGQLSILTNVVAIANVAPLTGVGVVPGFTLTDSAGKSTTTVSVAAGSTGTASLVYTPVGGFSGAILTTCAAQGTAPAGVTCTAPATFTLSGTAAVTQTVSFATTSRVKTSGIALESIRRSPWSAALLLTLVGLLMLLAGRTRRLARIGGLLALLLAIFLPAIGCAKGGSGSSTNPGGTPAGSYTYTVTATSGTTSHAVTVTLVVQ